MKDFDKLDSQSQNEESFDDVLQQAPSDHQVFKNGGFEDEEVSGYESNDNESKSLETKDDRKMKFESNSSPENKGYKFSKDIFKILGLTVSGLLLVLSLWTMAKSFVPAQTSESLVLSYNTTNQVDYSINLIPNDFYETASLGKGEIVPVTFIDNIVVDFASYLSANKQLDINYSYRITGTITASASDGNSETSGGKIWTKNYTFVTPRTLTESATTGYSVQEKVVVDYQIYNDLVNQYKLKAAIPMDAVLTITLTVDANSVVDGSALNESNSVSVEIPLSVSTVQISTKNDGTDSKSLTNTTEIAASKNFVLLGISIVIFISSLIATILLLKSLRKMTEDHSLMLKFNKIMRDYNQIIIEIEELPEVKNAAVIEVKAFKDMLDVQKELHLPIMCCKSKDGIITNHMFYIVNQNQIFKYRMNGEPEKF